MVEDLRKTRLRTDTGALDLEAEFIWIGDDLLVAVWGGEKPHIGAVSVAQSRPSLKNPETRSATASVICYPAHKEDELAKAVSEILSATLDTRVVVTAGIHWENINDADIAMIVKNSQRLVELILEAVC